MKMLMHKTKMRFNKNEELLWEEVATLTLVWCSPEVLVWSDICRSIYVRFRELMLVLSQRHLMKLWNEMDQKMSRMFTYDSYN